MATASTRRRDGSREGGHFGQQGAARCAGGGELRGRARGRAGQAAHPRLRSENQDVELVALLWGPERSTREYRDVCGYGGRGGLWQRSGGGGRGSSGYNSGINTIHSNLDRYNSYTEKAKKRAGGSKSSEAYTYIITNVEKVIGVVGVNLATGETDRTLPLKEKEPNAPSMSR
ncbi:MAG: hypothetical protein EXS43_07455 [Opitutus sp.]|nr:hypothetical protein [Opitutus sp.]